MTVAQNPARIEPYKREVAAELRHERWAHCHVNWTAIMVGALAAFSTMLLFGLIGIAVGAHTVTPDYRVVDLKTVGTGTLVFSVFGAFLSAVVGGWCAAKVAGILHAEPAILHGAIVWLATVPLVLIGVAVGAAGLLGGWYSSFGHGSSASASTPFVQPVSPGANATSEEISAFRTQRAEYDRNVKQWQEETPRATRNAALGTITALLLSLVGSVIGGWMGSGEPMNFTHYRTRTPLYHIG